MFKSLLLKGRTLCLLLCCIVSSLAVTAQTKRTGKVIGSDDKLPLVGASVRIKGTNNGAVTDVNGDFSLSLNNGDVLVVSYLTYQTQEVTVGANPITVSLVPVNNSLNEVVVTGYAVQKKKDLVGAVAVVDVAAAQRQPTGSVENQLQGQASGVTVITSGQPGEAPQVKIRGVNTFGDNSPLYVVDGVPTTNVTDINPSDVANMQVLKDAGSASIYGSRAANGVIIITTKKGSGKVNISYDAYYGTQVPKGGNVWDVLTPTEMMQLQKLAITNTANLKGITPNYTSKLYGPNGDVLPEYINAGGTDPYGVHAGDPAVDPAKYNVIPFYTQDVDPSSFYRITKANQAGTDWYHELFKTAPIQSHNVQLSGSTDLASYLFSLNYYNQQGTLIETYDKRYTIRANTSFNVSKHFRVGENLSYSATENPTKQSENNEGSSIGFGFREQPIIPVHDIKGNYAGDFTAGLGNAVNPVAAAERTHNNFGVDTRLFGNVYAEADLAKYFTLRTSFGGEYYSGYFHSFGYPQYENSENTTTNNYNESSYNGYNFTWTNTLKYAQTIGKHNIQFLVGTEAYQSRYEDLGASNSDYFSFDPNYTTVSTGRGTPTAYSDLGKDRLFSYIARLDYTFNDKYLLNATLRRDGSSKFLNQYGWFPAASVGWRISQEDFLKGVKWINDLKIRGGYGVMGNQINVSAINAFSTYGADKGTSYYDINGTGNKTLPGFKASHIGNPDAKWEKDANLNIGFDGTFFNQKLEITADYYKKNITDLLVNSALPGTAGGADVPYANVGAMGVHGFDLSVATHGNITSDLKFNANLTLTTYKNQIKEISLTNKYFEQDNGRFSTGIVRDQVGGPISGFFGYQVVGFWNSAGEITAANAAAAAKTGTQTATFQDDAAPGRFKYADVNGDGVINSNDRTIIGDPNPKFTSGLNFGLTYKQWDFNMFWYWSYGNKVWNDISWWTDFYPDFAGAKSKTALYDSWSPSHLNATAPIQETASSTSSSTVPNSYFVQPGSYLRLKNSQIGYSFSPQVLKGIGISKLRVYVSGANLITITKYKGPDPEITGNSVDFGVDRGQYAPNRTYLIGAQVKF